MKKPSWLYPRIGMDGWWRDAWRHYIPAIVVAELAARALARLLGL